MILNLSSSVDAAHVPNEYNISNLYRFIHRGMVDRTILIWIDCILCRFIVRGMVDRTSLIWIDRNLYCSFFLIWFTVPP